MIKIYIFSYREDAEEALISAQCAAAALPEAVVTVVDDSAAPVPEPVRNAMERAGIRYCQTGFQRNGNLRGPDCVRGIISTLAGGAEDGDITVKIDSDTLLLSGDWIREMERNGLAFHASGYRTPQTPAERPVYGTCYAISGREARRAANTLERCDIPPLAPEDLTIFQAVQSNAAPEDIHLDEPWTPFHREGKWTAWNWFSIAAAPEKYADFSVVTFGNPRPTNIPKSERPRAMEALFRYRFREGGVSSCCPV